MVGVLTPPARDGACNAEVQPLGRLPQALYDEIPSVGLVIGTAVFVAICIATGVKTASIAWESLPRFPLVATIAIKLAPLIGFTSHGAHYKAAHHSAMGRDSDLAGIPALCCRYGTARSLQVPTHCGQAHQEEEDTGQIP